MSTPRAPETPHRVLMDEILLRLFDNQESEDFEIEPYGSPVDSAWGSAQWVKWTLNGRTHYSRMTVERRDTEQMQNPAESSMWQS